MKGPMVLRLGNNFGSVRLFESMRALYEKVMVVGARGKEGSLPRIRDWDNPQGNSSIRAFLAGESTFAFEKHSHPDMLETFVFVSGRAVLLTAPADNLAKISRFEGIGAGTMIIMPRNVAHTFYCEPGSRMICFATAAREKSESVPAPHLVTHERVFAPARASCN